MQGLYGAESSIMLFREPKHNEMAYRRHITRVNRSSMRNTNFFSHNYLLKIPHKISFVYDDKEQKLESVIWRAWV